MFDKDKLDSFFEDKKSPKNKKLSDISKHTKMVRMSKLLLPAIAASIIGLLLIIPNLKEAVNELAFDITKPKLGELEKLHVENTVFYITDADNKVSNFYTSGVDETSPGSKLIRLTQPEGTINAKNNTWVNIKSGEGYYNQNINLLDLVDKTKVFFSEGMNIETEKVSFDFSKAFGYSNTPVIGHGIFGELRSEGLEFYTKTKVIILKGKTFIKINEDSFKENKR